MRTPPIPDSEAYHVHIQHPDGTVVYAEPRLSGYGTSPKPYPLRRRLAEYLVLVWAPRAHPKATATLVKATPQQG